MIATLGDLVEDVVVWPSGPMRSGTDTPARIHHLRGGSAANVASMVATTGGRARFIGSVGDDATGGWLVASVGADGVDVRVERIAGATTATIVVVIAPDGERSFLTDRATCSALAAIDPEWLDGVDHLHVPAYSLTAEPLASLAVDAMTKVSAAGGHLSLDASSTGALTDMGPERFVALVTELGPDALLANQFEAEVLGLGAGTPCPGAELTILRQGPEPTLIVSADGTTVAVPVDAVGSVVDTTGAGDAFAAGWLVARSEGLDAEEAVRRGHALAARVLSRPGADLAEEPAP